MTSWPKRLLRFFLLCLLLGGAAGWWVYQDYRAFLAEPLPLPDEGLYYQVERGASINTIARDWRQLGLVRQPLYLIAYARLNKLAPRIKAGEYHLLTGMTVTAIMDDIIAGRTVQYTLTIPEGWTYRQMLQAIWQHPQIVNTLTEQDDGAIMAALGAPGRNEWVDDFFLARHPVTAGAYLAKVAAPGIPVDDGLLWTGVGLGLVLPAVLRRRLPGEVLIFVAVALALVLAFAVWFAGG